jgi:hypothetical protein
MRLKMFQTLLVIRMKILLKQIFMSARKDAAETLRIRVLLDRVCQFCDALGSRVAVLQLQQGRQLVGIQLIHPLRHFFS